MCLGGEKTVSKKMLKWSTTRSNGKVIGEEIRRKLEAEKMSLEAMLRDDLEAGSRLTLTQILFCQPFFNGVPTCFDPWIMQG